MSITPIVPRRGVNDEGMGKKHALYRLINAASTEYVWLQDDDVDMPSPLPEELPEEADMYILPLRMDGGKTLLERLQKAEYAAIQGLTIRSAQRGHPVMCSGANMIVRRQCWMESYADLHPEIASGDDMFLLESFKRRGLRIVAIDDARYTAVVHPVGTWKALIRQRMRWAGKSACYRDREIIMCGILVLVANMLQIVCPLVLLIKFPIEYSLIKKRDASISLFTALLLELLYPWYMLLSLVGGLSSLKKGTQSF